MLRRVMWAAALALLVVAGLRLRLWISGLNVSASHTTLHVGETVQLAVSRKTWLGTEPLAHPERTRYITTWESMAVVEPDGRVTAVGTGGKADESAIVMVRNGRLWGSLTFSLGEGAPGPSLDFEADGPPATPTLAEVCCSRASPVNRGTADRLPGVAPRCAAHRCDAPRHWHTLHSLFRQRRTQ